MGVNKKAKRKIICFERNFYWHVKEDAEDFGHINLHIVSEDKKFVVTYEVGQSKMNKNANIVIQGTEFEGLISVTEKGWKRILTPMWDDEIITPSFIAKIINWCFSVKTELVFVDWQGKIIH